MKKVIARPSVIAVGAVCVVICCGGEVYGITPFGAPMLCAFAPYAFIGFLAPVYILCSFLFTFKLERLYLSGAVSVILIVRWLLSLRFRKLDGERARIFFSVGAIVGQSALLCIFEPVVNSLLTAAVGMAFYYFGRAFAACADKKFSLRLSSTEAFSACIVLLVAGLTFGRARTGAFDVGLSFALFCGLMLGLVGAKEMLAGAVAVGIGLSFGFGTHVALSFIGGVSAVVAFRTMPRYVYTPVGIGVFAAIAVLLGREPIAIGWDCCFLAAGGLLFVILPRRKVAKLRAYFDFDGSARYAVRHYINRTRADAGNKMLGLATVFDETARLMSAMREPEPDCAALGLALSDKFCPYCSECGACGDEQTITGAFTELCERAYSGRSVLSEMPEFFKTSCVRTAEVIAAATAISDKAREKALRAESDKRAKLAVTERLTAIKDVLGDLGVSQSLPVGFDGNAEERIAAEISLGGAECAQAFVIKDGVTAIVRTDGANRKSLERAVSVCMKRPYELISLDKTQAAGWSVAAFKSRATFEAVYARAGVSKSGGVSGDSYTFERIGDRFLVALADGMGTGETAGAGSGAAVDLIECFYKAGFDSTSALSGVNRFLKVSAENYSAVDVAVCDLDSAEVDIIKIGSPPCFIKTQDTVLKIEGKSLPIGVLDEMRPFVVKKKLYTGQMLIFVTDGVSDCFSGDKLPEYINGLDGRNPETLANKVLSRALELSGGVPRDDMTVIAVRLFKPIRGRRFR